MAAQVAGSKQSGGLQPSSSHQRLSSLQKYPDLRRIQAGGSGDLAPVGMSPHIIAKQNLSPRMMRNHSGHNLTDFSSVGQPLYARGHSKIGSGVIRPFQGQHHISNTLV